MGRVTLYATWRKNGRVLLGDIEHDLDVHVYVDQMPLTPVPSGVFRIINVMEPFSQLKGEMINYFVNHKNCYNHIFTYHEDILNGFENSTLSVSPISWVKGRAPETKEFNVSTIVGGKHQVNEHKIEGYNLRWELFTRINEIKINKKFYLSSHFPVKNINYKNHLILGDSKEPLFDSQFHIAIENTSMSCFTEKLIDCFQTRVIPIYYGPNDGQRGVSNFFNTKGMFIVNNVSEIIDVCNSLNENTYNSLIDAVEENYNLSMDYRDMDETILNNVKKLLLNG